MKRNWVGWTQGLLVVVAIGLVASFFLGGMVGGAPRDTPASPSASPSEQSGAPVQPGDPQPGVPQMPVAEHETWPTEPELNPDRQLDVEAAAPTVDLEEPLSQDLTGYWTQSVNWAACGEGALCAKIRVPLDWEKPGEAALEIAMRKVPSDDPQHDPMFLNPGGPGVGGQFMAESIGNDRWPGYDKIAWDPRGTGESTAVACGTQEQTDEVYELDGSPDEPAEERALVDGWAAFAKQCRDASGELLDHLTTIEVVRDLDLMRHLVGAQKLNFLGVSYGTYLGAMYAELFPERVGRMVLDSAVDITDDEAVSQIEGFELALRNYADWCAAEERCTFGNTRDEVLATIDDFLTGLDSDPIAVGDREVTQGLGTTGVMAFLYADEEAYEGLTYVVMEAMQGRGGDLLSAADNLNGRGGPSILAFPAMRCADWPDEGVEASYERFAEIIPKAPVLAPNAGMDLVCELWTADSAPRLKLTGKGAPELLVIGTTGDSATPYEHAVTMAEQLVSGVLVTFEGAGHGSATGDNECLNRVLTEFYEDGTVPDDGTTCN
ncbi:alpha/beta hydrolase [Tessaracoccus sp. OS52]|uniref:alpha/beta hydrolase n=1 Tax=Tessaracoccus sp. OS52 TaxID=2886691 RepID=UPI001D11E332|nr:alpha/beta hydrolase [Tessaracoccus sp. OS52]MCC2594400.1 alpha/beta hydrolase [Tessaracoccus sp. OS52]